MGEKRFRRRIYLVNPRFQLGQMLSQAIYNLFMAFVIAALFAYFFLFKYSKTAVRSGPSTTELWHSFIWFALALVIVACLISILSSHKVFGPFVRFRETMRRVSGGDLTARVRLRKRDKLVDLAAEFNSMLDLLHTQAEQDDQKLEVIAQRLGEMKRQLEAEQPTGAATEKILGTVEECNRDLTVLRDRLKH